MENVIKSELKPSMHGNKQAPDATTSTHSLTLHPTSSMTPSEPHCSANRRANPRNEPIGRRRGRGRPSPIKVPHTALPLPSVGAGEHAQGQGVPKRRKDGAVPQISSVAIERASPTCTADHAPSDRPSKGHVGHQGKKRKLGSPYKRRPLPHLLQNRTEPLRVCSPTRQMQER